MDDDMEEVLIGSSGYTEQVKIFFLAYMHLICFRHMHWGLCEKLFHVIFQVSSRKSYKHEDMEDEEETVVLFSREGEGSHDLD